MPGDPSTQLIALTREEYNDFTLLRAQLRARSGDRRSTADPRMADHEEHPTPDVYIARTPATGIPALSEGAITGTGSLAWVDDHPGQATCQVYRISAGVLRRVDGLRKNPVFNISTNVVPGNVWIDVKRDKFGTWFVKDAPAAQAIVDSTCLRASTWHSYVPRCVGVGSHSYEVIDVYEHVFGPDEDGCWGVDTDLVGSYATSRCCAPCTITGTGTGTDFGYCPCPHPTASYSNSYCLTLNTPSDVNGFDSCLCRAANGLTIQMDLVSASDCKVTWGGSRTVTPSSCVGAYLGAASLTFSASLTRGWDVVNCTYCWSLHVTVRMVATNGGYQTFTLIGYTNFFGTTCTPYGGTSPTGIGCKADGTLPASTWNFNTPSQAADVAFNNPDTCLCSGTFSIAPGACPVVTGTGTGTGTGTTTSGATWCVSLQASGLPPGFGCAPPYGSPSYTCYTNGTILGLSFNAIGDTACVVGGGGVATLFTAVKGPYSSLTACVAGGCP